MKEDNEDNEDKVNDRDHDKDLLVRRYVKILWGVFALCLLGHYLPPCKAALTKDRRQREHSQ